MAGSCREIPAALLPGAPLDGVRLLRALLWWRYQDRARAAKDAARVGRVLGFVLLGLGFLELIAGSLVGLWVAFVGWFIVGAATAEGQASQVEGLKGVRVDDVMNLSPTVLAEWWTVEPTLAHISPDHLPPPAFPLVDFSGQATGALTVRDLERVPVGQRAETRLRDLVRGRARPLLVRREAALTAVALQLRPHGGIAIVVDDDDPQHPIGVLTTDDLARMARTAEHDPRHRPKLGLS